MKVALITAEESAIPQETAAAIRSAGLDLVCRECHTQAELLEIAADAEILWMFGENHVVTAEVLELLPECRALFRSGSGVDALPVKRATELGIAVCNTPESIAESVAEHTMALLLALVRQVPFCDREVRDGFWNSSGKRVKWHLAGRTLGLVGYGRIARHVQQMAAGFGMNVIYHDPTGTSSLPLEELLGKSDFVSLHCPLLPATYHLMGTKQFKMMKPGALLINTSRGAIVDEDSLVEILTCGHLGGAALDVTEAEPPPSDHPLLKLDNVIITPHMAAFSADFEKNFWSCSVVKLAELSRGNFIESSMNLK
jgi:D-3-phosphoglycerate dehydrogenase